MSKNVDITFAANSKEVQNALDSMNRQVDKATAKVDRMSERSKRGARGTSQEFRGVTQSIGEMALKATAGFASMTSAGGLFLATFKAMRNELDEERRRQKEAFTTSLDVAGAVRATRNTFSADATVGEADLEREIVKVSERTGAQPKRIAAALADAFSAKGSLSNRAAIKAVEQAFNLDRSNQAAATTLSGSALDIGKISGTDDARVNLGFIANAAQAARITSLEKVSDNLVPAIIGITKFGDSLEQAGELATTLTQLNADKTGAFSGSASQRLGTQLINFNLQRAAKGEFRGQFVGKDPFGQFAVPEEQFERFRAAKSTAARIGILQESPELRRAFEGQATFEAKSEQAILSLLRGDKVARDTLAATQNIIKGTQSKQEQQFQAKLFEEERRSKEAGRFQGPLTAQEEFEAARQREQLSDLEGVRAASARKIFDQTLKDVNLPGVDSIKFLGLEVGKRTVLQERIRSMEKRMGEHPAIQAPEDPVLNTLKGLVGNSGKIGDKFRKFAPGSEEERDVLRAIEILERQKASGRVVRARPASAESVQAAVGAVTGAASVIGASNPEMAELIKEMKEINKNTREMARQNPPRPSGRQSSRLSRSD